MPTRDELERAAAASWPAAIEERLDGWVLRATPGASGRRLNSALPPAQAGTGALDAVARWYGDRGMPPIVQVTPAEDQAALDAALDARGWSKEAETAVLRAPARAVAGRSAAERVGLEAWLDAWRATGAARAQEPAAAEVLTRIDAETAPLVARRDGHVAGVAVAVLQPSASIVFSVAVAPEHRRRGVASDLMRAWANAAGDRTLFLQVMEDNAAGLALYGRLGFSRSHGYWYRRAAGEAR